MNTTTLYAATVLIWGSTWLAINYQLGQVPAELSVVYRFAIASALLFAWCALARQRLGFGLRNHGRFIVLGILMFGANFVAAYRAQAYLPSALNAVMFSTMVWMNIVNARIFLGIRSGARVWQGALLGVGGVALMMAPSIATQGVAPVVWIGIALSLAGALSASFGNIASHSAQSSGLPILGSTAWAMLYGAVFSGAAAVGGAASGVASQPVAEWVWFDWSLPYVGSLLYLAIVGSILGFACYLRLIGTLGPHRAVYVVVLFPVVATLLSVWVEGFEPTLETWCGIVLILAGNLLVLGERESPPKPAAERRQPIFAGRYGRLWRRAVGVGAPVGLPGRAAGAGPLSVGGVDNPVLCCDAGAAGASPEEPA